jgi:hypothetical protein
MDGTDEDNQEDPNNGVSMWLAVRWAKEVGDVDEWLND